MTTPASVEEYMAGIAEAPRAVALKLRTTIRAAAPEAAETISYASSGWHRLRAPTVICFTVED